MYLAHERQRRSRVWDSVQMGDEIARSRDPEVVMFVSDVRDISIRQFFQSRSKLSCEPLESMIQRFDQLAVDLPEPDGPNPAAAAAVQELMGGKFGEMSTLMNYTFQSFNFRGRDKYRPFYELICNIAAEEYSHIEAVAATINLLLNGATPRADRSNTPMPESGVTRR